MADWLEDLLKALQGGGQEGVADRSSQAHPDVHRRRRKGVPEVVLAEGKPPQAVVEIVRAFLEGSGRALISRAGPKVGESLRQAFPSWEIELHDTSRMVSVHRPGEGPAPSGGKVGIIAAGTSDLPAAEEARIVATEMGCEVLTAYDVGVAGIHRLFQPLQEMTRAGVDAIVVAAGMDGALPSVVAGLVEVPVIGLPTSCGYGAGGKGLAALLSMLQSCSPGLVVVNIDNGVGAGATAGLIANRMAAARAAREIEQQEITRTGRQERE